MVEEIDTGILEVIAYLEETGKWTKPLSFSSQTVAQKVS